MKYTYVRGDVTEQKARRVRRWAWKSLGYVVVNEYPIGAHNVVVLKRRKR